MTTTIYYPMTVQALDSFSGEVLGLYEKSTRIAVGEHRAW
jgi:hypothetical protein